MLSRGCVETLVCSELWVLTFTDVVMLKRWAVDVRR